MAKRNSLEQVYMDLVASDAAVEQGVRTVAEAEAMGRAMAQAFVRDFERLVDPSEETKRRRRLAPLIQGIDAEVLARVNYDLEQAITALVQYADPDQPYDRGLLAQRVLGRLRSVGYCVHCKKIMPIDDAWNLYAHWCKNEEGKDVQCDGSGQPRFNPERDPDKKIPEHDDYEDAIKRFSLLELD